MNCISLSAAALYNKTGRYMTIYIVLGSLSALTAMIFFPTYRMLQHNANLEIENEKEETSTV